MEEVYPQDVAVYVEVGKRNKLEEYLMQLSIVQNPHTKEPRNLFNRLQNEIKRFVKDDETLDKGGIEKLKNIMNTKNTKGFKKWRH